MTRQMQMQVHKPTVLDHVRVFVVVLTLSAGMTFILGMALMGLR